MRRSPPYPEIRLLPALLLFLAGGVIPASAGAQESGADTLGSAPSSLWITSEPESALVFVDGERAGTTPLRLDRIAAGRHAIRLVAGDPADWFSNVRRDSIFLEPGAIRELHYHLDRQLAVMTIPSGAELLFGDSLAGTTPALVPFSLARAGEVRVRLKGSTTPPVTVDPGDRSSVTIPLAPGSAGGEADPELMDKGTDPTAVLLAAGGVILSGAAAAHFKITADERNVEYLRSGDPALRAERDRNDLRAGISLAALQVSAVLLFTFLLADGH
jgi:hypothetical protein